MHGVVVTPGAIQPGDARMEAAGPLHDFAQGRAEQGELMRIAVRLVLRQAAVAAQLEFGQFASEMRPLVQQPGDGVHHARGGAQRLATQRDPLQILVARAIRARGGCFGEGVASLVGQQQSLFVKHFHDRAVEIGGLVHGAGKGAKRCLAMRK